MAKSFNKYRVQPNTDKPQVLNDPILKFFNGGFLMPAKQGGILAYPYKNNQSGYVAPRMDVGGFNTTTQTTTPPWMKAVGLGLSTNPVLGGIGGLINYFSSDGTKGKSTPSTPAKQKSIYDQMQDFYSNADRAFYRDHPNMQNVPYSGKTIKLTKGRLTGADVDTGLLDFIKKTAAKNNMDPYKLAALISRESTFGVGTGSDRAGSLQSLVSGWNVDQDYVPYQLDRFLADKKVPGVKSRSDSRGWHFWIDDQDKVNEYLRVHPNLLNQYQKKLASVKKLDKNASYFDLASQWINKPGGIRKYNPGAPAYESLYNQDLKLLQSDPEFSKYFSSKEMGGPVGIYGYRNYDNDILSNKAMGGQGPGDDELAFQQFFRTLPLNLRKDSPDYNIRGYWNGLGRPNSFDYTQPKQDDGYYHATSRNPQTGEILKAPFHPTFKQAINEDRKAGYFPIVTPDGKIKTVSGNDLKPGQSVYANGGDISIPDLNTPDWLTKYDEGGPGPGDGKTNPPIYTTDPRKVKAYNDSLNLYNYSLLQAKNYFNQPVNKNETLYSYDKARAVDAMKFYRDVYGTLANSPDDTYGKKISDLQKKTGILPIGERYLGEGSNLIFKKPKQPYTLEKEPILHPKKLKVEPIPFHTSTPLLSIKAKPIPSLNIPPIQEGHYKVDYFDPTEEGGVQGGWHTKSFMSDKEASDYMNSRTMYGPSMTQRVEYKNGGWLDQFEDGGWLEDYEEFAYGGELPTAKTGAVTNAPCPPGPNGEMMIRVDGKCVPYKSIKKPVYIANDQGDYSTKYTSLVGKYTKPGSKLPAIVGPGVVYPSYLKKAYDAYNKDGKMKQETGMVFQNGKWIKADQVQTQDQILAKHFNKKQQAAVDKYWNQQMADPRVKEFIMNDPVAYQSLRLEAYRAAGVDKYTMKTKACAAGFGYVWDDEKQTCVPISTKQKVSKEAAYRSLNPMYYREALSGVIGNSTSLTGQDATIEKILPSSGVSFSKTFGKNKIPIYTDAKANTTGTVMPNQQLAHVFSDPTGKLKFIDVAYSDGKSISDLNNVLTQEKQEEYVADKTLQNTLNNIHKNGLKATGTTGSDWLIKPGEFGSANNPYLKEAVKRWTVNSPGYAEGADWKLHSGNLSKLYNKGSWLSRATNTLSLGSNMAENEGYGKTGYMIPDFFRNVALGTTNDITTAARLTRGAYNKYFANPTDAVVDERGISIDSPTGIQNENAQFNKSQIGLLGAGNIPNLYFAEKDLAKSGKKFWEDPSFSGLGNMALNAVNVPFQAWLSTPLVGGFSKAGVKTAEKKGVNVLSKDYLKTVSKEGLQGTKKTVGDIIGQYEGKTLSQQIKTATGIPFRFVPQAYWGPATRLTQFPMRAFGETVAKSPFGFKAGTDVWEKATGTNPFHFMWDPIPEKFYDPYGEEVGYDIKKTTPTKTTTVPNIPNAYKSGSDTLYNVKVGDKIYQLDTKNNPDAKELFKEIKLGSENYDPKTQLFTLPVKKEDINIYQEVLSPFIKK
jgi:hypothetical protein